jgi:hypothetical protein
MVSKTYLFLSWLIVRRGEYREAAGVRAKETIWAALGQDELQRGKP